MIQDDRNKTNEIYSGKILVAVLFSLEHIDVKLFANEANVTAPTHPTHHRTLGVQHRKIIIKLVTNLENQNELIIRRNDKSSPHLTSRRNEIASIKI